MKKVLVFDSHPVQYRAPVWRALEKAAPGAIHVVYASDCSVRGHVDGGFGRTVTWDEPLLDGYANSVLNCEKGKPLSGWGSLTGVGVSRKIEELKPDAVMLTGLNYRFDLVACIAARKRNLPVWLRCENQDHAVERGAIKSIVRSAVYRSLYKFIDAAFYIGELNRQHYIKHGLERTVLFPAHYTTVNRFSDMEAAYKNDLRAEKRKEVGADASDIIVGFSGKFISKKNPDLLFEMINFLDPEIRSRVVLYFLGSGDMKEELSKIAKKILKKYEVKTYFAGFANQSELPRHYLAMDILVLPSRKMGETWGLVANEAIQAGCAAVVSSAVGCGADFSSWERFRVFSEGDPKDLAKSVTQLTEFPRSFDWAKEPLEDYSIEATVREILEALNRLDNL